MEERELKELISEIKADPGSCPDLAELSALMDGLLNPEEEERLRAHLAHCAHCLELLRIGLRLEAEPSLSVSESILAKAKALFKPNRFKKAISFLKSLFGGGIIVEKSSLRPAYGFRGIKSAKGSMGLSTYSQEFGPYRAEVELEEIGSGKWQVLVSVEDKLNKKLVPRGIRVSLSDRERELESLVLERGRAIFEPISIGEYRVEFLKQGKPLAGLIIRMKGEGK